MLYECTCECHKPGSAVIHFMPCCDGRCPVAGCGIPTYNMPAHLKEEHPGWKPEVKRRKKPRWKDIGKK